jgi:hypothetical protein
LLLARGKDRRIREKTSILKPFPCFLSKHYFEKNKVLTENLHGLSATSPNMKIGDFHRKNSRKK